MEKDAPGAFSISTWGLVLTGPAGKPRGGCCSGTLHAMVMMLWDGRAVEELFCVPFRAVV